MADKAVSELIAASQVNPGDLFVLEQDGTAKKLTGQTLENWLLQMANGHGGIHKIEKTGSNGLADTYRMTFADTTTFDYIITNGKGIADIKYGFKDGLIDHYNVLFNDGTTFTYTVTNGAKGDKGDAWYVWFKYASQMPTEASHSIGDVIDNCMGIYSGTQPTKPTDWKAYQWFRIKGEKGDTGAPAILLAWKTEYQVSTSGKVPPSGVWTEAFPATKQGDYIWTRTTQTYNTGTPVVAYSVGYLGKDGTVTFEELTPAQKDEIRGGHYTPVVTQPNASTMNLAYIPSKEDLPPVEAVSITLPAGPAGKDYILTEADKEEIAGMAQKNVPAPNAAGDAVPKSYVDSLKKQFTNVSVQASAFKADTTYPDFPLRAAVPLTGVTASMVPDVTFGVADATSGNFAPVASCYAGGIYLYAQSVPDGATTIPTIICWKGA